MRTSNGLSIAAIALYVALHLLTGTFSQEVSDSDFRLSNVYSSIGNEYFRNHTYDGAILYYEEAVRLNYFHVPALVNLGVVYVEKDMLNLAESYFRRAHELSGEFLYHVHNGLSSIYLQRGDAIKALRHGLKAIIIARNHLDPAVDAYEYQQGISNIGLILRTAGSLDAGKIRTLLKSYNLPTDYRVYFEEAFQVVVREINAYRKSHNPKCFLRILDSGRWHTSLNMQVMLLKSYSTFNLRTGFFYGTKPRTAGDRLSARLLTEPLNDFSPQYPGKSKEVHEKTQQGSPRGDFLYRDRATALYAISDVYVDGRAVGTIHDGCNVFIRSNDFLPPGLFAFGALAKEFPIRGSGLPSKRFDFAISIVSRWTDNYYHFLIESIPRMVIMIQEESIIFRQIKEFGLADKMHADTVKIPIVVRSGPAYIHELMTLILRERESRSATVSHSFDYAIEDLTEQDVFSVKRLFTVDWHGDQNMFNLETAGSRYALQKSQLYFSQLSLPKSKTPSSTTKVEENNLIIFVSRSLFRCGDKYGTEHFNGAGKSRLIANHEQVINEIKMQIELAKHKYRLQVENGCSTMIETIRTWRKAHTIVGVHGAGLSNMVFTRSVSSMNSVMASKVNLIEITPPEPAFRDYFHLAASLNIKLWVVTMGEEGLLNSYLAREIKVRVGVLRSILKAVLKDGTNT